MKSQNKHNKTIQTWINPLSMPSIILSESSVEKIDLAILISDLCRDSQSPTNAIKIFIKRYHKLSTNDLNISFIPAEKLILEKVIWQLKSAKQAFCLADFIGCISLCGMVCEMAIIFIYDCIAIELDINRFKAKYKKIFVDRAYEKWGQKKRINKLKELGAISGERAKDAHNVRKIRRLYLHFLSKDYAKLEEDAYKTYKAAFRLIKSLVELPLGKSGGLAIPIHLKPYLESKGLFSSNSA